jgi:hypothetical protein
MRFLPDFDGLQYAGELQGGSHPCRARLKNALDAAALFDNFLGSFERTFD